jgi:hypothetical protein
MSRLAPILAALLLTACPPKGDDSEPTGGTGGPPDTAPDSATFTPDPPGSEFEAYCGDRDWQDSMEAAVVHELTGGWSGSYTSLDAGTLFTMKFIPPHPFEVTGVRVGFAGDDGPVKIRLVRAYGRTYPDLDRDDADLMPPIEVDADIEAADMLVDFPIGRQGVYLEPTQHYILVVEQLEGGPGPTTESQGDEATSRGLIFLPGDDNAYGMTGNFRMELYGSTFCAWEDSERWFEEDTEVPFASAGSSRIGVVDLDGDGHEDVFTISGGPQVFLGDGLGAFEHRDGIWPDAAAYADHVVFADVDNDGDQDAFLGPYVGADDDDDGTTKAEGDCNDADPDVGPGEEEIEGNGVDDDCDGVADDGLDESDDDGDGWSILMGDCDDTCDTTHPEAEELRDSVDNDCDGQVDEQYANRIALNDGGGVFTILEGSGVEVVDHSTTAAFGDGDGDGALDVYWGNWLEHYPDDAATPDRYFEGLGDGRFEDMHAAAGLTMSKDLSCFGVLWNDFDNDGWQDIFVGNYHLYDNQLWQNQGDGTFVDVAGDVNVDHDDVPSEYLQYPGGHTYGGDFGDIDNDGDMDMYMCNLAHPRTMPWSDPSMFVRNGGAPDFVFDNVKTELGLIYDEGDVNATFADFDNDMDLDLAVASLYTNHYSRLYRNDGEAGFTDVTYQTGTAVHDSVSVVWADVDEDGDLDLLTADRSGAPYLHLFENRVGQDAHWLQLELVGTSSNRDALGARVTLEAGGVSQLRDVRSSGGHSTNQTSRVVHFGLAGNTEIDSLMIRWPAGAGIETVTGLEVDHRYRVVQGSGSGELVF